MSSIGGEEGVGWEPRTTNPVYVDQLKPSTGLSNPVYVDDMYYNCLLNISHVKYLTGIISIKNS
jgi:hypothetical protein